ncbi:MAG: hypothetical protein JXB03_06840 [Spirochaetales bacterium]|nr:hypothetical protein [Spirochaetales bacterium]
MNTLPALKNHRLVFLCELVLSFLRVFLGLWAGYPPVFSEFLWNLFVWPAPGKSQPLRTGLLLNGAFAVSGAGVFFLVFLYMLKAGGGLPVSRFPLPFLAVSFVSMTLRDLLSLLWVNIGAVDREQAVSRRRRHILSYVIFTGIAFSMVAPAPLGAYGMLPSLAAALYIGVCGIARMYYILMGQLEGRQQS